MKAAFLITLAIGGVNCFPKLAPIIQNHVERHVFNSHVRRTDGDGGAATTTTNSTHASSSTNSTDISSSTNSTDDSLTSINVTIVDTTGTLQLNPGIDGNLFISLISDASSVSNLVAGNSQFLADSDSSAIGGDNTSRMLFYYPQEMSKLQVSRLRLGAWGKIPIGAQLVTLMPIDSGSGKMFVVLDTNGNYFWPIICALDGKLNKLFIAKDVEAGPGILLGNGDLSYILTGGNATDCMALSFVAQGLD